MGSLFLGCDAGPTHLGSLPEGDPAEIEPGYTAAPLAPEWRPPRVVPRCGRIEPRTSTSPAIEILSSGGFGGEGRGNVQIWEDGTVLFDGGGCPNGGRRRGKMSPARVRAVIDTLEAAHFFEWSCDQAVPCTDSFITSLTVQRGRADNTVRDSGCDSNPTAARAIDLVMHAIGRNACSPMCLETPAPAFCR